MMKTIQVETNDKLAVIALNRGRSNPINAEMIAELKTAVADIENDNNLGGLIITGKEGFFTSGIDLIEAYNYNAEESRMLWTNFLALQAQLISFKKPLVAAISGHSPAGGCVLAMCCDYRLMAAGKFIIGLNEVPVGIIVPEIIFSLYSFWIGKRKAYQYLLNGELLSVDQAFKDGLIDAVCEPADLFAAAKRKINTYMQFNPITWSQSKINFRKELISQFKADHTEALNKMLQQWWAPETRRGLEKMIANLKSPPIQKA